MDCFTSTGALSRQLVKVARPGMITEQHLASEICCAYLVRRLGLIVADTQVVAIREPYLAAINETLRAMDQRETLIPGWAIGATDFPGFQPINNSTRFSKKYRGEASILYAFDLMSMHYDRLSENPNCGLKDGRLFVFDFDQCFPYITEQGPLYDKREPWQVARVAWREGHLFRSWLKTVALDTDAVASAFSLWDTGWLRSHRPIVPREWEPTADRIWEEAENLGRHLSNFVHEVEKSLL